MITKFNDYINESLRDKMVGVPLEEVQKKIDNILDGTNEEITDNLYHFFVKIYDGYSYADVYEDLSIRFDFDFTKKTVINFIKDIMDETYYKAALKIDQKNTERFLNDINDLLEVQDDYMYMEMMEDLINLYDPEEFKEIALEILKKELKINDYI